ncbi:Zn-dependent alcohol dehydrogenase [Embleya scabrispora]|uniref:Zn-dependent alcohol dehydrogenase n=1 Tax=Embleya scabrispora TaxID=159449 RepID=UPI00036CD05C|nr:Zn-dependent alcohol dehydrogenase [Embleya scabrispora]MYS85789.1 zinc-binding dehydrogenase [Streptomyces sp. SID5474]
MRAAVLNAAPGRLDVEDLELDTPGPREVVVRTAAVGLCHSDLQYIDAHWSTALPEVLGHEASGVVEAVGTEVTAAAPGDHVVTCMTAFCGRCRYCVEGRLTLCVDHARLRTRPRPALLNHRGVAVGRMGGIGAFAETMLVHENSVVPIGRDIPLDRAALLGCAVITGVGAVWHSARVRPGATVAVIGCGGVGLAVVQGARLAGAGRIIAVDIDEHSLEQARRLGATAGVNARTEDVVDVVRRLSSGGVDYAFEAIGRGATVEQAFAVLAPGGVATVLGMVPDDQPLRITASELFFREKRLQGSLLGSHHFPADIPRLTELYAQGRLELDGMISRRIGFDDLESGLASLREGGVNRVVVEFA